MSEPLSLRVLPTFPRVPPGPSRLWVVVELLAGDLPAETERPNLSAVLALDVSGSMAGPPLEQVIRSVDRILDLLGDRDRVGVVAFSTRASTVAEPAALDAPHKRALRSRVARLRADDQTNIQGGLELAASLHAGAPNEHERRVVVLLSDGQPNVGLSTRQALGELSKSIRPQAAVSTLGYGARHDEGVLLAIADQGGGCYRFIADPAMCQLELAQAVGAQADIAIEQLELTLRPRPGVEIASVLGATVPRFTNDGLLVAVPDIAARASRTLVIELRTELSAPRFGGSLFELTVRYRRAGEKAERRLEGDAAVDVVEGEPGASPEALAKFFLVRADRVRSEARDLADRGQFEGAAAHLRALMTEIAAAPGYQPADGSALSEAWEQLLDEAMAMERRPAQEALAGLKAHTAMKSLSYDGVVASSRPLGRLTQRFTGVLAGGVPEAYLVGLTGPSAGIRFRLLGQNTLGRTTSADVVLKSPQVSRRHADVFAVEGGFYLTDLGSTNVTRLNGTNLGRTPALLKQGDIITVGDSELRFELG